MTDMTPNEADVHQERQLLMLGYKIAGALMRIVDADVTLDVDKRAQQQDGCREDHHS